MSAPGITREELQQLAIAMVTRHPGLLEEREASDVVFVVFEPRIRTVVLVTPHEAASRLAAHGLAHDQVLAELESDPATVNHGAPGFFWVAGIFGGAPYYGTMIARRRVPADAAAAARGLN